MWMLVFDRWTFSADFMGIWDSFLHDEEAENVNTDQKIMRGLQFCKFVV